jgi:uncharacterized protein YfeS
MEEKIKLHRDDLVKLQVFEDAELNTKEQIENEENKILENINYWLTIQDINLLTTNLGKYYCAYLFTRDFIQLYIENTALSTSLKIIKNITPADDFFKSKMLPKKHHYEKISDLKRSDYFWHTHSIHPVDLSVNLEKEKAHPYSLKILKNYDFFWDKESPTSPFGDKHGETSLYEFRAWRANFGIEPAIKCLDWILNCFEFKKSDYNKENVNLNIHRNYSQNELVLDKTIVSTAFAQLVDEGIIDKEVIPITKVALKKLIFYTELESQKITFRLKSFFSPHNNKHQKYILNLNHLLSILHQLQKHTF